MNSKLVIYGAGEIGRCFIWQYLRGDFDSMGISYEIVGFIDDIKAGNIDELPVLGNKQVLPILLNEGIANVLVSFLHPVGDRLRTCLELESLGFTFPSFYQKIQIPPAVKIGKGVIIHPGAVFLGYSGEIGDFSTIGLDVVIEGGVKIGKGVILAPQTFVGYETEIGEAVVVFPQTYLRPKIKIGKNSEIWPKTLQYESVPENTRVTNIQKRKVTKKKKKIN